MLGVARELKKFFDLKRRVQLPCKVEKTCKNAGCHVLLGGGGQMAFLFFWGDLAVPLGLSRRPFFDGLCIGAANFETAFVAIRKARKTCKNAGCHMLLGGLKPTCKDRKTCKNAGCHVFGALETIPGPLPKKVCLIRKRRKIVLNTWFGRPLATILG